MRLSIVYLTSRIKQERGSEMTNKNRQIRSAMRVSRVGFVTLSALFVCPPVKP